MAATRSFRPVTPRLERRRTVDRAWQLYVQEGLEPAGITEGDLAVVARARVLHRIDPGITRPGRRPLAEGLEDAAARRGVPPRPHPRRLRAPPGLHDSVLAYLDSDGWMLSVDGDRQVVEQVHKIDFAPARWSEEWRNQRPGHRARRGQADRGVRLQLRLGVAPVELRRGADPRAGRARGLSAWWTSARRGRSTAAMPS